MKRRKKYTSSFYVLFPIRNASLMTYILIALHLGKAMIPTLQIWVLARFIDNAYQMISTGTSMTQLLWNTVWFISTIIADRLIDLLSRILTVSFSIRVNTSYELLLLNKRYRIAYPTLEQSEANDLIERVVQNSEGKVLSGFSNIMSLVECLIRIAGIVYTALTVSVWTGLMMLFMFAVIVPIAIRSGQANYEAYEQASEAYRRAKYDRQVLAGREYVSERTLFGYTHSLNHQWQMHRESGRVVVRDTDKKNEIRAKIASILIILISMLLALALLFPVYTGVISSGLFISILTATIQLLTTLTWNLSFYLEQYSENKSYLMDLSEFMKLPDVSISSNAPKSQNGRKMRVDTIKFIDISFRYPGCDELILNQVNFVLEYGNTYGFVGENGAGKTTIIKLLLGLYTDYEGTILVNGEDIKSFDEEQRRNLFSVVHQDHARYQISVWDNITIGCQQPPVVDEVMCLLEKFDLKCKIDQLPNGLRTDMGQLDKIGVDFSGGEWQKIAIARALLQQSPIQILDEPTSSLDPIHESDLYDLFANAHQGDIRILITHRLGGVKNADCIFVLENGKIVESGAHEVLMAQNGIYADMYNTQGRWYQ